MHREPGVPPSARPWRRLGVGSSSRARPADKPSPACAVVMPDHDCTGRWLCALTGVPDKNSIDYGADYGANCTAWDEDRLLAGAGIDPPLPIPL